MGINFDSESEANVDILTDSIVYKGQIEHVHTQKSKEAKSVPASDVLPNELATLLPHDLYTHQASALDELNFGENVCVATSTSSGKTMVYGLKIAWNYLRDRNSTSLIVYPTKALSKDQKDALEELYDELSLDITIGVYDGDTSQSKKKKIRENANVIITNFPGLNAYLPYHTSWASFFSNLELMAIDESHSYTGVQGMHVGWIMRRLKRVVNYYDSDPQYVLTSATIGNPGEHSSKLVGEPVVVIDNDGSPRGERKVVFWNPPIISSNDGFNRRRQAGKEASELTAHLSAQDIQTLTFVRSRKLSELAPQWAEEWMEKDDIRYYPSSVNLESYHAGHGKEERRQTEDRLKSGIIDGIFSTNALELGIDIGSVDATVLTGYPGTRQSFWQQLGRSGRGGDKSIGVMVADYDSISQYLMNNPDFLTEDSVENAVIDLENNQVYSQHVLCAANELPIDTSDYDYFGGEERLKKAATMWKRAGKLTGTFKSGINYTGVTYPQENVNLYSTSDVTFDVRVDSNVEEDINMEPIDKDRAYRDFHEGAIYLHKGKQYQVSEFVERGGQRYLKLSDASDLSYYTRSQSQTKMEIEKKKESKELSNGFELCFGEGKTVIHYEHYQKIDLETNEVIEHRVPTTLPPIRMETQMMWIEVPDEIEQKIIQSYPDYNPANDDAAIFSGYLGGLHAIQHGLISVAPLQLRMDKRDLDGISVLSNQMIMGSGFFIYDDIEGGVGFSRSIYENFTMLLEKTKRLINRCECTRERGCPVCVMHDSCGANNSPLHKSAAVDIIDIALGNVEPDVNCDSFIARRHPSVTLS